MKQLTAFIALFLCAATASFAQIGAHAGIHGMFNTLWIINQNSYGAEEYDYTLKTGVGGGLVLGYNFTDHIGLQTELNSIKMGQNYENSHGTGQVRKYNTSYIGIPLLLKYTSGEGTVKFYGQIGPQFNFLSNANIEYTDTSATTSVTISAKDRFSKTDVGLNFGLGANIDILPHLYLNAGLSFYYGFTDINSKTATADPLAYDPNGTGSGTWRWPSPVNHKYEASHNGYGGLDVGIHYMFIH